MKTQHGRHLTGEEMGELLEEFANGASRKDLEAFAEQITRNAHRTIQQKIMSAFLCYVEKWGESAERPGLYDSRNEATVRICKKILDSTGDRYDRYLPYI